MTGLRRLAGLHLVSDASAHQLIRGLCFVAGPMLMIVATLAVARLATTPGEVLLGVMSAGIMGMLMVVLGLIVPLAEAGSGGQGPDRSQR